MKPTRSQTPTRTEGHRTSDVSNDRVDAALRLASARRCVTEGRLADAGALYAELCARCPADATVWFEAGRLSDSLGDAASAERRLEHAASLPGPHRAAALQLLAITHLRTGRPGRAARVWLRIRGHAPNQAVMAPEAWAGLLVCALIENRPRLRHRALRELRLHTSRRERRRMVAERWLDAAPTLALRDAAPTASPLRTLLAQSAATLARAAKQYPMRADIHHHHAVCAAKLGRFDEAAAANERALRINRAYTDATRMKLRLGRLRQAA